MNNDIWGNLQGLFQGFFSGGVNHKKGLQGEKEKWRSVPSGRSGPPPENFGIFELPRLDFLQFQHYFRSFLDKKELLLGAKTSGVASSISEGDIFMYSCSAQLISSEINCFYGL